MSHLPKETIVVTVAVAAAEQWRVKKNMTHSMTTRRIEKMQRITVIVTSALEQMNCCTLLLLLLLLRVMLLQWMSLLALL